MATATPADLTSLNSSLSVAFEAALSDSLKSASHREVLDHALDGGHRARPLGCLLACIAVGGDGRDAMSAAIGVELIHKASIIRDDIVDDDKWRGGKLALHLLYGVPTALAASDVLWTMGLRHVAAEGTQAQRNLCLLASADALAQMASGQLEDVAPTPERSTAEARLEVDEHKTGALSELSCRLGAILGGGPARQIDALGAYGRRLGTAFQVLNTVRNLQGLEPDRAWATDLKKRRDTVLSAHVRAAGGSDIRIDAPGSGQVPNDLNDDTVATLRVHFLDHGADHFGESIASTLLSEARDQLQVLPQSPARALLEALAEDELMKMYAF